MAIPSLIAAPRPLTIGIDARAATEVGAGRGRVVRELLRALSAAPESPHRYLCYARTPWEQPLGDHLEWRLIPARDPLWHVRTARAAGECDVFLSTNSYLTVMLTRAPAVAIVYDLCALDPATGPNRRSAVIERLTLGGAVRRARALVCISRATRDGLVARYPAAAGRATVAHLGVTPDLLKAGGAELSGLPEAGFVLAVGTLEPRKNLPRLVAAYAALPDETQRAHPLVVVGAAGWRTGATLAALQSLGDRCIRLGRVSDAALAELYRRSAVFCYPSLGEGFGLPVLEAMAAGAAVITSNLSSLPEVGGEAALYVNPWDVADITRGLSGVLADAALRRRLGQAAQARAAGFSWAAFAAAVLRELERGAAQVASRS